ncbi:MAG TPA: DUF3105 domain-containing protein [Acidimicrobiales bacterium]|nr:DUF3105 domain-containing protein [Acidimicrobiales bacterium]
MVVDPLDSRGNQHVLPGAPTPTYAVDPPTSGPHDAGEAVTGLQAEPLTGPVQVTVLELGGILLQYRPDLPVADRNRLAGLAGDKVVVAPNPSLPAPLVATAWRRRLSCRGVDLTAVRIFIVQRKGKGPG